MPRPGVEPASLWPQHNILAVRPPKHLFFLLPIFYRVIGIGYPLKSRTTYCRLFGGKVWGIREIHWKKIWSERSVTTMLWRLHRTSHPLYTVVFISLIIDALNAVQIISIWIYLVTLSIVTARPVRWLTRAYGECTLRKWVNMKYSWDMTSPKLSEE